MSIQFRHYNIDDDYKRVSHFLIQNYQAGNMDGNWLEPAWEYMHYHPALDKSLLGRIGIWEENGEIVAAAHYEWQLGDAFFQFHPAYRYLRAEMLRYAEETLFRQAKEDGRKSLCAYVNDNDQDSLDLVRARGYERNEEGTRPLYRFDIPEPFPTITLPSGFCVKGLADECDWAKVNRVMWRGFNHEGEPPSSAEELEERRKMFETPSARLDLKIVVEAPNGDFVAFCGMFFEPTHQYAYVEPVATDPDYRRMGLGKAAVLEGIRRCCALGARVAYVGSDQAFYQAIGFKKVFNSECWMSYLD
jgi:predicted N-acetyltransferase YhbS